MNNGLLGFPLGQEVRQQGRFGLQPRWPTMNEPDQWYAFGSLSSVSATSGAANTKGTYAQFTGNTEADANWCGVSWLSTLANHNWITDIAIDRAGSATPTEIILENAYWSSHTAAQALSPNFYAYNIGIPKGSSVFARVQSESAAIAVAVFFYYGRTRYPLPGSLPSDGRPYLAGPQGFVTPYGVDTSDTTLRQVDPGGVANTYGSWVEIASQISYPTHFIYVTAGNLRNTARANDSVWTVDIGIGGSGQEYPLFSVLYEAHASFSLIYPPSWFIPIVLPVGQRLVARAKCNIIDATDRLIDIGVFAQS